MLMNSVFGTLLSDAKFQLYSLSLLKNHIPQRKNEIGLAYISCLILWITEVVQCPVQRWEEGTKQAIRTEVHYVICEGHIFISSSPCFSLICQIKPWVYLGLRKMRTWLATKENVAGLGYSLSLDLFVYIERALRLHSYNYSYHDHHQDLLSTFFRY